MADEALASFQLLLKNVPEWIHDLENIMSAATEQQTAILAAEQSVKTSIKSLKKSIASSLRSNTSSTAAADITSPTVPTLLNNQLPHLNGSDVLRLSQRKRKTASVCSRVNSQLPAYRSRNMVAIYYDGNAQRAFETLVRAIGSSRNAIRKGKLGMKLDSLARFGSSSSSGCSSESGEETIKGLGTFTYRTTTTLRRPSLGASSDDTAAFDKVDGSLEKAQLLCEQAAHQILRDGDCGEEVTKAKAQFEAALTTINAELPNLTKEAAKSLKRKAEEDERHKLEQDGDEERRTSRQRIVSDDFSLPSDGVLEVDLDEVADDSENEDFDISTMRLPPRLSKYTGAQQHQLQNTIEVH